MSNAEPITLVKAQQLAQRAINLIDKVDCMERVMVAGSIRRGRQYIGDVELVAIPRIGTAVDPACLFRTERETNLLDDRLECLLEQRQIAKATKSDGSPRWGNLYKAFKLPGEATHIELFCANPDNWGVILGIRTGSAHFSRRLVTKILLGGKYRVQGGHLRDAATGEIIPCPDEETLFKAAGLRLIHPSKREIR